MGAKRPGMRQHDLDVFRYSAEAGVFQCGQYFPTRTVRRDAVAHRHFLAKSANITPIRVEKRASGAMRRQDPVAARAKRHFMREMRGVFPGIIDDGSGKRLQADAAFRNLGFRRVLRRFSEGKKPFEKLHTPPLSDKRRSLATGVNPLGTTMINLGLGFIFSLGLP